MSEFFNAEKVKGGWIINTPEGQAVTTKDNDVIKALKSVIGTTKGEVAESTENKPQQLNG